MKLPQSLNDLLNAQIIYEYSNMLVYKKIESFFESRQLTNLANYFSKQAQHEKDHGDKFLSYINNRTGGNVVCDDVPMPDVEISDWISAADIYVTLEEATTENIELIYDTALREKSYLDLGFIQKMLTEQVEEENSAQKFFKNISMVKDIVLFDQNFED